MVSLEVDKNIPGERTCHIQTQNNCDLLGNRKYIQKIAEYTVYLIKKTNKL